MLLVHFLPVLRTRWRLGVLVFSGVVALIMGVTLLQTPKYTATAAVVLDVKTPDPLSTGPTNIDMSSYMATQLDVLRSERVALKAIDILKLDQIASYRTDWQNQTEGRGDYRAWLAERLSQDLLAATTGRESNAITVSYTHRDPEFAAAMANAIVRSYMDTSLELKIDPSKLYNDLFDERAKSMREAVGQAQVRLSQFQRDSGITSTDERIDVESAKLTELTTQFIALQALTNDSGSRLSLAGGNADRMQEVLGNSVVNGLTAELASKEAKLREISVQWGDKHPQVIQLKDSIEQLKISLATATRNAAGSINVTNKVNAARLNQASAALEAQRSRVLQLRAGRDKAAMLSRDVENAQRAYDSVYSRVDQTGLASQLNQTNIALLKTATPPAAYSRPKTGLNTVLALLLGTVLAAAACVLREISQPIVRSAIDITETLGVPLLGQLSKLKFPASLPHSASPQRAGVAMPHLDAQPL